jgi:hypothetical protein
MATLKDRVIVAIVVAVGASIFAALVLAVRLPAEPAGSELGLYSGSPSLVIDRRGDAKPEQQYQTNIIPEVRGYHDITSAGVKEIDDALLFTIWLAGDPNLNEKYETNYVWHIITPDQTYTVLLPNFAPDGNFTAKGWYFAVYNNTSGKYVVPMAQISAMPQDRVEFPVESSYIGSPPSFHYWVSVHVRVYAENLSAPPEYLMDYAP